MLAVVDSATRDRLADLRRLLGEKFPVSEQKPGGILPTGLPSVDAAEGGLRRAALTELHGSSGSGALFLQAMLRTCGREKIFAALVDAGRSFEAANSSSTMLSRLLLVLCSNATHAIKSADLLLRDGNLSVVLLDLQAASPQEIRRIPASTWHRFQRLVEQTATAFVVLTAQPIVEGAQVRIATPAQWTLAAQRHWRSDLLAEIPAQVLPRRAAALWERERNTA